jgi:membrane associated rhomboid family serine protease
MDIFNRLKAYLNSLPSVTRALLIFNVIAFVITYILAATGVVDLNEWLGLHNLNINAYSAPSTNVGDPNTFKPIEIITHMFLHGGVMHIFFNMFGLVMFGRILENMLGSQKFFILYFSAGLGAAALQLGLSYWQNNSWHFIRPRIPISFSDFSGNSTMINC